MAAMLHLAGRRQRIPRVIRERANDLDFMNDDQLVEIYRLNRHSIFEVCEEVEVMERKTRRSMALPVSLQVGASNVGPGHDDIMSFNITISLFN